MGRTGGCPSLLQSRTGKLFCPNPPCKGDSVVEEPTQFYSLN